MVKAWLLKINRTTRNYAVLDELVTGEALSPEEVAMLKEINRDFTHVTIGGKHKVVSLKPSQAGGVTHVFEDLAQFQHYFHHKPRVARKLAGTAWQSWAGKNYKPGGVGFYPVPDKCPGDVFNMFEGLALEPVEGDCSPYLDHLLHVICAGNVEAFHYLIQWMAHIIQKPDEKPAVAIVMKSVPGTGKGTTVKPCCKSSASMLHISTARGILRGGLTLSWRINCWCSLMKSRSASLLSPTA